VLGNVQTTPLDFTKLLITTVAFKADNSILAMRSRNFDVDHGTGLYQMYQGFESTSANVFNMYNGEW
jgi:hypothetical protein